MSNGRLPLSELERTGPVAHLQRVGGQWLASKSLMGVHPGYASPGALHRVDAGLPLGNGYDP